MLTQLRNRIAELGKNGLCRKSVTLISAKFMKFCRKFQSMPMKLQHVRKKILRKS